CCETDRHDVGIGTANVVLQRQTTVINNPLELKLFE
ncbi:MAG: hypothetical protein K0R36_3236, partial [Chryseobacterium sp.]|nr:hypothetical protein [Chryseobacterium sp.]